jgi:hypothetical protein
MLGGSEDRASAARLRSSANAAAERRGLSSLSASSSSARGSSPAGAVVTYCV